MEEVVGDSEKRMPPLEELARDLADLSKEASRLAEREVRGEGHFDGFDVDRAAFLDHLDAVHEENRHSRLDEET